MSATALKWFLQTTTSLVLLFFTVIIIFSSFFFLNSTAVCKITSELTPSVRTRLNCFIPGVLSGLVVLAPLAGCQYHLHWDCTGCGTPRLTAWASHNLISDIKYGATKSIKLSFSLNYVKGTRNKKGAWLMCEFRKFAAPNSRLCPALCRGF